jgi:CRISPR/Cas system-associated protein Csx1
MLSVFSEKDNKLKLFGAFKFYKIKRKQTRQKWCRSTQDYNTHILIDLTEEVVMEITDGLYRKRKNAKLLRTFLANQSNYSERETRQQLNREDVSESSSISIIGPVPIL